MEKPAVASGSGTGILPVRTYETHGQDARATTLSRAVFYLCPFAGRASAVHPWLTESLRLSRFLRNRLERRIGIHADQI
jgi:hypothetical protein